MTEREEMSLAQESAHFEESIKTTAWYSVMSRAKDEDDDGASMFRMAKMAAWTAWQARAALSPSVGEKEGDGWLPIESAPKDGTYFIALVGGLPYKARYDETGRFIRMAHTNRKGYGRSTTVHHVDGKELIEVLKEGADDSYEVSGLIWSRGFDFEPTHWLALPALSAHKGAEDARPIALEALELVAMQPATRGVYLLDQQDMDFVKRAVKALKGQA